MRKVTFGVAIIAWSALATMTMAGPLDRLVSIGSGSAGNDSVVNVGIGGGGGNIADVKLGRSGSLASANVSTSNGLSVDANVGGLVSADVGVGGGSGIDIDIGIGGGDGSQNPGTPGTPGGPGGGSGFASLGGGVSCSLGEGEQVLALAAQTQLTNREMAAWARATGVQIIPVALCAQADAQVERILRGDATIGTLRAVAGRDALIAASLSRTRYDANDVFAIQRSGRQLLVYVL